MDNESFDEYAARRGITFAPRDMSAKRFTPKNNFFGIGYKGISAKVSVLCWIVPAFFWKGENGEGAE